MTADERIEALLNEFGQTISDLPSPDGHTTQLFDTVMAWYDPCAKEEIDWASQYYLEACEWYICHLADVIDRMEWALENARVQRRKTVLCKDCIHWTQTVKANDSDFALGDCSFHGQRLVMNEGFCAWGVPIDEAKENPEW